VEAGRRGGVFGLLSSEAPRELERICFQFPSASALPALSQFWESSRSISSSSKYIDKARHRNDNHILNALSNHPPPWWEISPTVSRKLGATCGLALDEQCCSTCPPPSFVLVHLPLATLRKPTSLAFRPAGKQSRSETGSGLLLLLRGLLHQSWSYADGGSHPGTSNYLAATAHRCSCRCRWQCDPKMNQMAEA